MSRKQKIVRHTLDELLTATIIEEHGRNRKITLQKILAMPMVFSDAPGHEVNLLSWYVSSGKLYVDVGEDE